MQKEKIDELKNIFYEIIKLDGVNEFSTLVTLSETFVKILKKTKYDRWKNIDIAIQRSELFGKVATYFNIIKQMATFFEEDLNIKLQ